jgi:predicted nucleotidyltransferase
MIRNQDKLIRLLHALFPGVKVYLFGSRARGTHSVTSDVDIALDTGSRLSFLELAQAKNVAEALNIPQTIDIVDLNRVPEEMKRIILQEGSLWTT